MHKFIYGLRVLAQAVKWSKTKWWKKLIEEMKRRENIKLNDNRNEKR